MLIRESALRKIVRQEILREVTQADLNKVVNDQIAAGGGATTAGGSVTPLANPNLKAVGPDFPPAKYKGAWQMLVGSGKIPGESGYVKQFWDAVSKQVPEVSEKLGTTAVSNQMATLIDGIAQRGSKHPRAAAMLEVLDSGEPAGRTVINVFYTALTGKFATSLYDSTQYFAQPDPQYWQGTKKLSKAAEGQASVAQNIIRYLRIILTMDPSTFMATPKPTPTPTPTPAPEPPPPPPNPNPVDVVDTGLKTGAWLKQNGVQAAYPGRFKDSPYYVLGKDPARKPVAGTTVLGPYGDPFIYEEAGGGKLRVVGGPIRRSIGAVFTHTQTKRMYGQHNPSGPGQRKVAGKTV
jgi:hypothetical protein